MILADTGPLVALFDPKDSLHQHSAKVLARVKEPLLSTVPILTEAFHMLTPASQGSDRLRDFILQRGLSIWFLSTTALERSFELMERYRDQPMDLADASLVVAAEELSTPKVFTFDRGDFQTYRVKRGHRYYPFEIVS
ncbi:MAG: type II toxin-antitoxin system VapC family toxin [Vicinamibacteria bacterium]